MTNTRAIGDGLYARRKKSGDFWPPAVALTRFLLAAHQAGAGKALALKFAELDLRAADGDA